MANGAFNFKNNSGNIVSFISGSDSDIIMSGGTLDLSNMTGVTLGNITLEGTVETASFAPSYLLTSSFNTYSGTTNTVIGTLQTSTGSLNTFTSSTTSRLSSIETSTSSLNTFTSSATTRLSSIEGVTGSYATTGSNIFRSSQTITGSLFISENLVIAGSSSIQYISSSVVNIDDNIITVNAMNPSVRFGGLAVIDSGSSPQVSGSMLFDSVNNQWVFVHQNQASVTSSVLLMGPETYDNLGNEAYLTLNRLPKGNGIKHLVNSNITDTGTKVSINSNTEVTGTFVATGTALVSGSAQILNGTGFVKTSGATITYDNTSYLPLGGGTLTGALSGTSATFTSFTQASNFITDGSAFFGFTLKGRASDNFGAIGFYNNNGATRVGYIQSGTINGGQVNITGDGGGSITLDNRGITATGAATFSNLVSLGGGSEGLRLGNVGDNSAYDNVKLYYTGFSGGSPRIYLTPRTTPGSGVINTFLHLQNTNGISTSSNNTMGLFVDGQMGIGTTNPGTKVEILSRAADADRTIPHNILTLTAEQGNAPYGFFGGAILFKNRSYTSGLVESSRIRSVIYDDGAPNNFGGGLWFETTATPGGTLTPSLVLNYQGHLGIGTSTPLSPLHLQASEPTFRITDSSDGGTTFIGSTGGFSYIRPFNRDFRVLNAAGVGLFTIKASGNTGVGITSPLVKLDVDGNIKNTARVFSGNAVTGNIAPNLDSAFTRNYILICDLNDIAGFSLSGFMNAASYTCWNISSFYIMKNYSATTATAGITGQFKAGGCDMNIVDLSYGGGRYIAIGYTSNPEIDVIWTGYRLTHMLNSDGSAQVVRQSFVTVNSTLASY